MPSRRGSRNNSKLKRGPDGQTLLRCPSADSNPGEDLSGLSQELVNQIVSGSSDYSTSRQESPDRTPAVTPPRVSLVARALNPNDCVISPETTFSFAPKPQSPENVTPRQSIHAKGTPARSRSASILDDNNSATPKIPSSRPSIADRGTPARSPRTSFADAGGDRTPNKITPPQTTRNSLVPPNGSLQDKQVVDDEHDNPSQPSQRSRDSIISNTSSSTGEGGSSKATPSRRSGVSLQREGSLGNVQVRVKKRRRSSGERQSEVSLNVIFLLTDIVILTQFHFLD